MHLLFRHEAVRAQTGAALGRVLLVRPLSLAVVTAGVVTVLLATGAFLSVAHYTRKAAVAGVLVPDRGLIRLAPTASGQVLERRVAEGQVVRSGDVLFVLAQEQATLSRGAAEQDAGHQVVVRAPQAGTIAAVYAEPGQSVSPQAALASLVPAGAVLQAHLYAPSRAVGLVRTDQPVRLRFEAYAHHKHGHWTGHVVQVSRIPVAGSEWAALALPRSDTAPGNEPMFRITVQLDPAASAALPLVAGMRLDADVLLERRRLIEWLFEPLLGLRGRI